LCPTSRKIMFHYIAHTHCKLNSRQEKCTHLLSNYINYMYTLNGRWWGYFYSSNITFQILPRFVLQTTLK
jgi:hypothetical protein